MSRAVRFIRSFAFVTAACLAAPPARAADPTTADCLAANNDSIDLRNDHKLRAARGQLLTCASASCPSDIRKECLRRVDELNLEIPTIVFEAKDPAGKDLSAVRVTMDGQPLADRLEGTAISIDPGEHRFTFETPGQAPVQKQYVILESVKDRRAVVDFGAPPPSCRPGYERAAASAECVRTRPPSLEPRGGMGAPRIAAVVASGVGLVGLGVGGVFGLQAISKKNEAQSVCADQCVTADGVSRWKDAGAAGNVSTIGFIVGVAGLAGAAVLWFTAPRPSAGPGTQVGVGLGGVEWKGTW